jgi:hypothetical protein
MRRKELEVRLERKEDYERESGGCQMRRDDLTSYSRQERIICVISILLAVQIELI